MTTNKALEVAREIFQCIKQDAAGNWIPQMNDAAAIIDQTLQEERAEVERLREALEGMVKHVKVNFKDTDSVWVKAAQDALTPRTDRGVETGLRAMSDEPTDGTRVLYYSHRAGWWVGNRPEGCERGNWHWIDKTGEWGGYSIKTGYEPIGWMPLPAAPRTDNRGVE